jgi:adenine specific DNA methylase Mod
MTELIWDGKYDAHGNKTAPLRVSLPFQNVETINESAQERQKMLDLFAAGRDNEWRNRLIWGDKKYILPSLLDEFAGKVNLIYIDPPFNVGADFSFTTTIHPEDEDDEEVASFTKEPNVIEQKAYRDTWGKGLDSYLEWFYETAVLLHELLADDGSIYVHLDYHIGHYAKAVLDEVFGIENFKNEVAWKRSLPHNDPKKYGSIHDVIFFYTRSATYKFNQIFTEQSEEYKASHYTLKDPDGRIYRLQSLSASGSGPARRFGDKIIAPPKGTHWRFSQENIDELMTQGKIIFTKTGTPNFKRYLDESKGSALQSIWTDVNPVNPQALERVDYATQKPEALLERILKASSNENDLVLDCFCGSGTTAAVAEKLNRRWITCDLGRFAIHTARKRLLSIQGVRPFVVQNLGKYERQVWQKTEFRSQESENSDQQAAQQAYTQFILKLYGARPINGYTYLHGLKNGRMVHVGSVDSPVTLGDVNQIVSEFKKSIGKGKDAPTQKGVDILGWDFAFEFHEVVSQQAAQAGVNIKPIRIPNDVMDKRAVEQGDLHFFELAALAVEVKKKGRAVTLTLTDFVIPPDDVPADVQQAVKHWSQWIDYWAVDWDYKDDTFHNQWQTYRTKQNRELEKNISYTYDEAGRYTIVVKVIDILGNDTTKTINVEVK